MRRIAWIGVVAATVVAGCGDRKRDRSEGETAAKVEPGAAAAAAATASPIDAGSASGAASDAMGPTSAERALFRKHVAAGRSLTKAEKWGDAVPEFEAALAAIPDDGRALSELGWAAFNAGDYELARTANAGSVIHSTDPKVKAASLYNLGRIAEATGEVADAAKHYRASLALRPHDTVRARLEALGQQAPAPGVVEVAELPCTTPAAQAAMCPCLVDAVPSWLEADWSLDSELECSMPRSNIAGVRYARLVSVHHDLVFLLGEARAKWSVVAFVGKAFDPGAFGVTETFSAGALESVQVGPRRVVRVTSQYDRRDVDSGVGAEESQSIRELILCAVPTKDSEPIACALRVPVEMSYAYDPGELAADGVEPADDSGTLRVDLDAEGTATVVLVTGVASPLQKALLGAHRLW